MFLYIMQKHYLQRTIDSIFQHTHTFYPVFDRLEGLSTPRQYIRHKKDKLSMSKVFDIRGKVSALGERYRISVPALSQRAIGLATARLSILQCRVAEGRQPALATAAGAATASTAQEKRRRRGRGSFYSA